MSETTLFYVLIFTATVLLTYTFATSFVQPMATNRKINRRIAVVQSGVSGAQSLELLRRERWLSGDGYARGLGSLRTLLVQSGIRFEPGQIVPVLAILVLAGFGLTWFIYGDTVLAIFGGIASGTLIPFVILRRARTKRIERFQNQLPDVIDLIVRSLRAGHPLGVAFSLAAREMPDPTGTEFGIASDEIQFGATVADAMANMSYRVGDKDLDYLITCISVQTQTGGNLGEVLSRLSKLMRDRFRLTRKVKAMTSEARISGIILSLFPIVLFGIIVLVSPSYYSDVWHLPSFHKTLLFSAGMLFTGNAVMRRMANIQY